MRSSLPAILLVQSALALTACAKPSYGARYEDAHTMYAAPGSPAFVGEDPGTEAYDRIVENAFVAVADQPLSTFSIDVDTASYANTRRFLREGALPPADAVRIEELVNYFEYDYPSPDGDVPFSVTTEVAAAPWNAEHRLVHIGLQAKAIEPGEMPPRNLVFLIDVSGSMAPPSRLPLLKRAFGMLVDQLGEADHVSIVVYAGASGMVLPPTRGTDKAAILGALEQLQAGGSTNGGAGIDLAYRLAERNFDPKAINRVILATDGDFNVGTTSRGELTRLIESKRASGVYLTILGFGMGNLKDATMEELSGKGNGNYAYIDTLAEARKVLVDEAGGTLVTVADDVKIQVELNPAAVASYRLIGYENRLLANQDFNDDTKDAGEIGAGHSVTALYEIVPSSRDETSARVDPLKYQSERTVLEGASAGELMTVKLRYKRPNADDSQALAVTIDDRAIDASEASETFRFSAAVAAFGMLLRDSEHAGDFTLEDVYELAAGALGTDRRGDRRELLELVDTAASLRTRRAAAR
jgi:Ca-activated chloride channel homolog